MEIVAAMTAGVMTFIQTTVAAEADTTTEVNFTSSAQSRVTFDFINAGILHALFHSDGGGERRGWERRGDDGPRHDRRHDDRRSQDDRDEVRRPQRGGGGGGPPTSGDDRAAVSPKPPVQPKKMEEAKAPVSQLPCGHR